MSLGDTMTPAPNPFAITIGDTTGLLKTFTFPYFNALFSNDQGTDNYMFFQAVIAILNATWSRTMAAGYVEQICPQDGTGSGVIVEC